MIRGLVFVVLASLLTSMCMPMWGFFGHRRINRMAVFTLPPEMIGFYKKNIEFITEHAIDPDKRRYATKHEGVRHYVDIDHWDEFPFHAVPRDYGDAILEYATVYQLDATGDSTFYNLSDPEVAIRGIKGLKDSLAYTVKHLAFTDPDAMPWPIDLSQYGVKDTIYIKDEFSSYGILPYWLLRYDRQLQHAFKTKDAKRILRISAEMGHYISDAHVPLHTTENYNGQMTDQVGIHAFWESRIPELFADQEYDYFVGKAEYIEDPKDFFWDIVLESHRLLSTVLLYEKELSQDFPSDKQWCYDERLGRTIRIQCPGYAEAYKKKMEGIVEDRMRASILSVASVWYSAWVKAGQPDLTDIELEDLTDEEKKEREQLESSFDRNEINGRSHDGGKGR